jgi:transcriptional regulator with XRE-family HTH domain
VERRGIFDEEGLKAFANRLKEVRKLRNLTQEELALRTELTLSQIARIETAKINTTLSTVFRIARVLNMELTELFDFKLPRAETSSKNYISQEDNLRIAAEE